MFSRHEVGPHGKGEKEVSELSLSQATEHKCLSLRRGGGGLFWSPQLFENFILSNITQRCQKKKKKKRQLTWSSCPVFRVNSASQVKQTLILKSTGLFGYCVFVLLVYRLLKAGTGYLIEPSCCGAWLKQSTFSVLTFSTKVLFLESCVSVDSINQTQF